MVTVKGGKGAEILNHSDLLDMPDSGGTNSDHDERYVRYSGSTKDVDLADNSLYAENVNYNEGLLTEPTIIDATGTAINISSCTVLIRSNSDWSEAKLYKFTVPANATLAMTDNSVNYVYVDYNSGSPVYASTTIRDTINNSNNIPVARVFMSGGNIEYKLLYNKVGLSAGIRLFDRQMRTTGNTGIVRESGLAISESGTRVVTIALGKTWFGISRVSLGAITMGGTGVISQLWYHSGGSWANTNITSYNNTQYDNGTDLVTLTANRYAVNWVYRNIVTNEMDIVLGVGDYTVAQATSSMIPPIPDQIANFYVLCGRIIVQKNSDTAYAIENVADVSFRAAAVTAHADLSGLTTGDDHTQYAKKAGDTYTGDHDFNGATTLRIPTGSNPGMNTAGQIAFDTTDNTLLAYDGTANRVVGHAIYYFTANIAYDGDWNSEVIPIWQAPKDMAITIVQVNSTVIGSGTPTLSFNIEERAYGSLNAGGTDITSSDMSAVAGGTETTSFSNAGIAAKAHLVFTTPSSSAASGTVDYITVTVYYTKNQE